MRKSQAKNSENQHNISHFTNSKSSMKNPHNPDVDTVPAQPLFINTLFYEVFCRITARFSFIYPGHRCGAKGEGSTLCHG
ncbi:hypothetical protein EH164_20880 [Kosakonia sp. CCTCC M2018092]|nr:hypothetical protein EH164_20880 [Kosakonia sp. CCTCC M2018092]